MGRGTCKWNPWAVTAHDGVELDAPHGVEHGAVLSDPEEFVGRGGGVDVGALTVKEVRVRLPQLVQQLDVHRHLLHTQQG